ncbi:MAG: bifunctional DNA-formamidopyrimidine glycosylase/DNA-(apurinic or apyrimidinic site) lyase [Candidatus Levybacteria bacterium]|nr:bifunctional DNA-formamidopyrimidine glycosylase/DNA-(apurinic or apyrimidinic site) lyase [Candidatus Levybacteria bacterium]
MPELPEVETIKLGLENKIVGLKVDDIEINVPKIFRGEKDEVLGSKIKKLRRRGKLLIIDLNNGQSLVIHLKLTGQLVYHRDPSRSSGHAAFGHPIPFAGSILPAKTTHVIFTFFDGSKLFYNDMRKFGWIKVVKTGDVEKLKEIQEYGPEPFTKEFTSEKFTKILSRKKSPVKLVLMDQTQIAGVGNIYANEALFLARVNPQRKSNELKENEIKKLYESLLKVLKEGIKYGGSSENAYVNALGEKGKMQDHFRVYARAGKPCPNKCGEVIKRISLGGRGTFYCAECQK